MLFTASWASAIPRHRSQKIPHPTPVGDTSKCKSSTDECAKSEKPRMNKGSQQRSEQNQQSGGDSNLSLDADHSLASHYG
jgi:hypothetical protein